MKHRGFQNEPQAACGNGDSTLGLTEHERPAFSRNASHTRSQPTQPPVLLASFPSRTLATKASAPRLTPGAHQPVLLYEIPSRNGRVAALPVKSPLEARG